MTTIEVQADFEQRFHAAISERDSAITELSDVVAAVPRLKAKVAQARADVAKLRADAKAAGVKLTRPTAANAANSGSSDAA